jgi:hypothetical protein
MSKPPKAPLNQKITEPKTDNPQTINHPGDSSTAFNDWDLHAILITFFTGILALVAVLQWCSMRKQAKFMRQTMEETRKAADAATNTVKAMEDTAQRQLRAYLFPVLAQIVTRDNERTLSVKIKNCGQTPAYRYKAYLAVGVKGISDYPQSILPPQNTEYSRGDVGPGSDVELGGALQIDQEDDMRIRAGTHALHVYGRIDYEDVFGRGQYNEFRLWSSGEVFAKGRFASSPAGSHAT